MEKKLIHQKKVNEPQKLKLVIVRDLLYFRPIIIKIAQQSVWEGNKAKLYERNVKISSTGGWWWIISFTFYYIEVGLLNKTPFWL